MAPLGDLRRDAGSCAGALSAILMLRVAALLLGMAGTGLIAAAAVCGLSRLVGPILALALVGAAFLLAAGAVWVGSGARRTKPGPVQPTPAPEGTPDEGDLAFAVGFALGRLLLRKLAG